MKKLKEIKEEYSEGKIEKKDFGLNETTIQFLPESGSLLSTKLNVIAFKIGTER